MHIFKDCLKEQITCFDKLKADENPQCAAMPLSESEGSTIDDINDCFKAMNDLCSSINKLFDSTSLYLHRTMDNIDKCEEANTLVTNNEASEE